jgi:hypothetical protein
MADSLHLEVEKERRQILEQSKDRTPHMMEFAEV